MDQFWPNLQLPKATLKMPWATAECDKIQKWAKSSVFMSIHMFLRVRQVLKQG